MAVQVDPRSAPRLPPPSDQRGAIGWLRHNLFRTPERCSGTWSYELTVGSKRSTGRIPCQAAF